MTIARSSTTYRIFPGAVIGLLMILSACSGDAETKEGSPELRPNPKEEVLLASFDVSKSPTPESSQAWTCDLRKYIENTFACGYIEITKVTADSFAHPARIFGVKCPKQLPWGHKWDREREKEERRVQAEKQQVLRYIEGLRPEADRTDLQGAFIRGKEDLQSLLQKNPRLGKLMWRIYSDFQAPLNLQQGKQASAQQTLSNLAVHLIFGASRSEYQSRRRKDPGRLASELFQEARQRWTDFLLKLGFSLEQLHWSPVTMETDCNDAKGATVDLAGTSVR